jgi:hypothetical protein
MCNDRKCGVAMTTGAFNDTNLMGLWLLPPTHKPFQCLYVNENKLTENTPGKIRVNKTTNRTIISSQNGLIKHYTDCMRSPSQKKPHLD